MTQLLSIKNLRVSFNSEVGLREVVHGFNIQLSAGQVIGVVGESGSGKSVSMLSIAQLISNAHIEADSMTLSVGEQDYNLQNIDSARLRNLRGKHLSYIFQEPMTALHPLFTCGQQVLEAVQVHQHVDKANGRQQCIDLFAEMKLPNPERIFTSYPHQLSGGQRQRVMIAMALANNPSLLIADEPTTALDSVLQKDLIADLVDRCKSRNMGLILISHDLQLIRDFTDEIVVMYDGKILEQGRTTDIVTTPKSVYTESLLQCQPSIRKKSLILPTVHDLADYDGNSFTRKPYQPSIVEFQAIEEMPYIEVKNITKSFVDKGVITKAVDRVDFNIYKGETLGLIGESGCGKSTVSKIIMGMLDADEGEILFQGKLAKASRLHYAKHVQMIFQDPYASLNPSMKVGKIIEEPIQVHQLAANKAERRKKVEDLLVEVGLQASDYDKYPHEFSGGQRQRISIARALSVEPELIICDESVSALDISVQAQILNLFNRLKATRKLTYLFISHDLNVVSYICDRILVMRNGELIDQGLTQELVTNPSHQYTKQLLSKTIT